MSRQLLLAEHAKAGGRGWERGRIVRRAAVPTSCALLPRKDPASRSVPVASCRATSSTTRSIPSKEAKLRYIEPFAPNANPQRFSDSVHVEKFFKLNCMMVLKRECTVVEKGDLLAWLLMVDGEAQYPAGRATGPVRSEEQPSGGAGLPRPPPHRSSPPC